MRNSNLRPGGNGLPSPPRSRLMVEMILTYHPYLTCTLTSRALKIGMIDRHGDDQAGSSAGVSAKKLTVLGMLPTFSPDAEKVVSSYASDAVVARNG